MVGKPHPCRDEVEDGRVRFVRTKNTNDSQPLVFFYAPCPLEDSVRLAVLYDSLKAEGLGSARCKQLAEREELSYGRIVIVLGNASDRNEAFRMNCC
mmetsp:Transcript_52531/g.105437  ORF Transcript_52531/g.105437 Transcript_52531/m.105437 type:complete len:97 (-) Transcript_52531:135-425(-)